MKSILTRLTPLAGLTVLLAGPAAGQGLVQAPTGPDGTWNLYLIDFNAKTFKDANTNAQNMVDPTGNTDIKGHLVTIRSQRKNDFIWRLGDRGDIWIGLTDREGVAPGAQESQTFVPNNRTSGWAWTNGEPFTYQNWGDGEPNDWSGAEDAAHIRNDGRWNDNGSGYGADDPIPPVLQPNTSNAEPTPTFKSAIEWEINSPNPIPGVRKGNVFADLGSPTPMPGPAPDPTKAVWSVREIQGLEVGNVYDAISAARSGNGNIIDGTRPVLDVTDPNTNTNTGSVQGGESPFFHDTPGDDNNLISINKGTINITEAGVYTFQVRSDDGFALRINGQTPTNVYGPEAAGIDPLDPETAFFRNGTGDANTRIVYNLPAGHHQVELVTWEGGGGAYYEFSSTKGHVSTPEGANWILVGDTSKSYGVEAIVDPVKLNAEATWYKVDAQPPGAPGALASIITTLNDAVTNNSFTSTGTRGNLLIGEADIPGSDDNYMLRVDASFVVDDGDGIANEALALTFRLSNDDGGALHILGQDFTGVAGGTNGNGVLLAFGDDMGIGDDSYTGDTNLFGHITLMEGVTYQLQAYMFEGGGGSRLQVQAALGTLTSLDAGAFFTIDMTDSTIIRPANSGIGLVPEPSSSLLALAGAFLCCGRRRNRA